MSNKTDNKPEQKSGGLAEDVLRQAGKSEEEAGSMGKIDRAEDELEATLDPKFRTGKFACPPGHLESPHAGQSVQCSSTSLLRSSRPRR